MKKLLISLFVVAAVAFTACGGATKTEDAATTIDATEIVTPATETSVFEQYKAIYTKNAELGKKILAGDTSAAAEATAIGEELTKFTTENADAVNAFTAEQQAELAKIVADAMK